jgi:Gnt-I system high-affinity gluconate transporter
MAIQLAIFSVLILILLISKVKLAPFLAFLITSLVAGVLMGVPIVQIPAALEKGVGSTLGGMTIVLCLGAMFGKLIAASGAAQKIAEVLVKAFGLKYVQWALMLTGFVVGIPLFYNVGFVLLLPLAFSVVYRYHLPAVYIALPMLAALSVTHGFLPPHPSPTALVPQFGANMGLTLFYGLIVAIPTVILAGPVFARTLRYLDTPPLHTFHAEPIAEAELPGSANSFLSALLPVILLLGAAALPYLSGENTIITFLGHPSVIMLIALLVAIYSLGIRTGRSIPAIMDLFSDAVKDISGLILIIAGAGMLKQIFVESGVSETIAVSLKDLPIHPLVLAWLIATVIRIAVGSATVAGLTAAGIVAPLATSGAADPNLMVLAVGAGSLMCSHVNDSGFWMFKEYFNLSLKETLRSWTLMETIVGVAGLAGVLILDWVI